ncbi:MAG: GreA/GreB family elongation factor, partial [Bacteroidota bacterium]
KLENQLRQAEIIPPVKNTGRVQLGSIVTVSNGKTDRTYQLLGSAETDPGRGIISHNSPIGAALLGRKIGDTVKIILAKKDIEYIITNIGY